MKKGEITNNRKRGVPVDRRPATTGIPIIKKISTLPIILMKVFQLNQHIYSLG